MSLLLTRTCEYAILVALNQGRHFSHSTDRDICIQSELDLRLPAAIDDLIPPSTTISTRPVSVASDGTAVFQTTLAYMVSSRLLHRLHALNACISLHITSISSLGKLSRLGTLQLHMSTAKLVSDVVRNQNFDQVNRLVIDRVSWQPIPRRREHIKVGLFIAAMPSDNRHSLPSPLSITTSNTPLLLSDNTLLSSPSSLASSSLSVSRPHHRRSLSGRSRSEKRADLAALDQLSADFARLLNSSPPKTPEPRLPSYHQVGQGTSPYTLYFSIIHGDQLHHLITDGRTTSRDGFQGQRLRNIRQPFFHYTFLSTRVRCPASSISAVQPHVYKWPTCFHLRGHLIDIQKWLDSQECIEVSLVLQQQNDDSLFQKQTVGIARVPLTNLAFSRPSDYYGSAASRIHPNLFERTFPVHDIESAESDTPSKHIASITVRIGLVSSWWKDEQEEDKGNVPSKRENSLRAEAFDWLKHKKIRHDVTVPAIPRSSSFVKLRDTSTLDKS